MSVKALLALPQIDVSNVDLVALKNDVVNILTDNLAALLQGGEEDMALFMGKIADDYVNILKGDYTVETRAALIAELGAQVKVIAEINRIRAVQEAWATATAVFNVVLKTVSMLIKVAPLP